MGALVFIAQGDMRQAVNNMQSTFYGFGQVGTCCRSADVVLSSYLHRSMKTRSTACATSLTRSTYTKCCSCAAVERSTRQLSCFATRSGREVTPLLIL